MMELLQVVYRDISEWSNAYGFQSIPPAVLLRQLADLSDNLGRAVGRL